MVNFVLEGLNQSFTLDVSGALAGEAPAQLDVSCVSIFNVKLSDMRNVFKFQSDSFDVNNVDASDIKYYVYMNSWPASLKLNPVHGHTLSSSPILATGGSLLAEKNLVKHDFVRYLAQQLFNTPHGVDLFSNEDALLSDLVSKGVAARQAIDASLNAVDQAHAANGTAPDKYSTNALNTAANFARVLLRQVANEAPSRFATELSDISGVQSIPLMENDTINFKLSISPADNQHELTGRPDPFDTRVYQIQLVLTADEDATNTAPTEADSTSEYPYHA